jgi:hypothetical protein
MIKNLLVNGCSFSRGPGSWPYHLKYQNIVNLAQAGAGNTYISETTIAELSQRNYDFVIVMWTGIHRVDFKVSNIDLFSDSTYTSQYQHQKNDWPEKIIEPINDQDYVEKNWVFGCGHVNNEFALKQSKLFESVYKHVGYLQFIDGFLIKMISLQNTLKQMQIPYLFTFYNDYENDLKINLNLYSLLDQNQIYNKENINNIAKTNNWLDTDLVHPGHIAHKTWAQLIQPKIEEIYESN